MASDEGTWVTINGQHILIKEGENPMTAYIRHLGKQRRKKNEDLIKSIRENTKDHDVKKRAIEQETEKQREKEREASRTPEDRVVDDIKKMAEKDYGVDDQFILYGQINETGKVSRDDMIKYFEKKGKRDANTDMIENPEKFADKFLNFAKDLPSLKKKMLDERKKRK